MVRKKPTGYFNERWKRETKFRFEDRNFVLYSTENNIGDVCAYDADMLVVGELKDEFDSDTTELRSGRNIVTDSLSQIVVTDYNNSCLHIIDQNGLFLKCLKCHGLKQTNALSLDNDGRLWEGLFESGEIKVKQYMS